MTPELPNGAVGVDERSYARACRDHRTSAAGSADLSERRRALSGFAKRFYEERLFLQTIGDERQGFDLLADPETIVVEIAHDGQLPHLGIVRMVLKAEEISRLDRQGIALYLVGDHYSASMRPENLRYGMPLVGRSPDAVDDPPRFHVAEGGINTPFCWLPPPAPDGFDALEHRLVEYLGHNVGHERRAGHPLSDQVKADVLDRLRDQFAMLRRTAQGVRSFGDWLIRVQHELLQEMLGKGSWRVILVPMTGLKDLLHPELARIAEFTEPRSWVYCMSCRRRQRWNLSPASSGTFACSSCGHRRTLSPEEAWEWTFPDVVAFQAAFMTLGIDGWVVGSRADYHPEIERLYARVTRGPMPPKFLAESTPVFRGIGDPTEGYGRSRLLRSVLEVHPRQLAERLSVPWNQNPRIISPYL